MLSPMRNSKLFRVATLLSLTFSLSMLVAFAAPQRARIKLATLVPEGSVWDKAFKKMSADWKRDTSGRVNMRVYPGGIAGDETDIIRKMRIGQLQAASLTVTGLAAIEPSFQVFETPLFFESHEEVEYVLERVSDELKAKLDEKGFILLHWGNGGWVHLFSKKPIDELEDLKGQKQWVWAGDTRMRQWWKENGFNPIPLTVPDIPTGLQTGLIEAVPTTPLAALGLQWFQSTPYMLDYGVVPYLGATVMTKKTWNKLSDADKQKMREAAQRAEDFLAVEVPKQEAEAIRVMSEKGVKLTQPKARGADSDWGRAAANFTEQLRDAGQITDFFDKVIKLRAEFRAKQEKKGQ